MANHTIAPFYQLGHRITFEMVQGSRISGEVMDTDTGWIAVKDDEHHEVCWYNLDHVTQISVTERA